MLVGIFDFALLDHLPSNASRCDYRLNVALTFTC